MSDPTEQCDADTRVLLAQVDLGSEAKVFEESKVGRYMLGRARQEAMDSYRDLAKVDPNNAKEITTLQNRIWRAESFKEWVVELIEGGRNAETQIQHNEATGD